MSRAMQGDDDEKSYSKCSDSLLADVEGQCPVWLPTPVFLNKMCWMSWILARHVCYLCVRLRGYSPAPASRAPTGIGGHPVSPRPASGPAPRPKPKPDPAPPFACQHPPCQPSPDRPGTAPARPAPHTPSAAQNPQPLRLLLRTLTLHSGCG